MEYNNIFVNGTFDILHIGHLKLLNYARGLGKSLVVAIDSDRRVKIKKGKNRPVNSEAERKYFLENLKAVHEVKIFDSDDELVEIIKEVQPDIMVVGSDWTNNQVIGSAYAKRLVYFERIDGYSTTEIIKNLSDW